MTGGQGLKQDPRRCAGILFPNRRARREHNADGLLHALKNAGVDFRLMPFGRTIDDPDIMTGAPQVVAHLLESRTVEEPGHGNKTHHARLMVGMVVVHFPGGPAPEVDIQVTQVLAVNSRAPFARRHPIFKRRCFLGVLVSALNPSAAPLGFLFVRRIADHHRDGLFALDLVGLFAGLGNGSEDSRNPALIVMRIAQRVGDEHARGLGGRSARQVHDFRQNAQLRHSEGSQLQLKSLEGYL